MNRLRQKSSWLLITVWLGINQLYWNLAPNIATYNNESLHTSALQVMHGLTLLVPTIFLLILGAYLNKQKPKLAAFGLKAWINTLVIGILTCLIIAMSGGASPPNFYDAFFPLLRNTYPLVFATVLGVFLGKMTDQLPIEYQKGVIISIWGLVFISSFSTPNMFGWSDKTNLLFYSLMFLLGWRTSSLKLSNVKWLQIAICAGIAVCGLQAIMPIFSINGSTIERFTTSFNFLSVVVAFAIAQLLDKFIQKIDLKLTFSYLALVENSAVSAFFLEIVNKNVGHSSFRVAILTIGLVGMALIIAKLWTLILQLSFVAPLIKRVNDFASLDWDQQIQVIQKQSQALRPTLGLIAISYVTALLTTLLMNTGWRITPNVGPNYNIFAYTLGQREMTLALTTLITFTMVRFVQMIIKRYWTSIFLVVGFNIVFVVANIEKIKARNEPILPSDLAMISVAKELFRMVGAGIWLSFFIVLAALVALVIWLEKTKLVAFNFSKFKRVFYLLLAPVILLSSMVWNQPNTPLNNFLKAIDDEPMFYNQLSGAKMNGPLLQYLNNVDVTVMERPSGYSKKTMDKIVDRYKLAAVKINKSRANQLGKQTVIFNLSESFANPNRVPGVTLKNNPIPFVTKMEKATTGGTMISSGYGGGTANMEYMTLTGFSLSNFSPRLPTPYTQLVPVLKDNPSIVRSFNHATAIHPYIGAFYSRITVYKKFGFDKFVHLGSKYPIKHQSKIDRSPYLSDKTSYANTLDAIKERKTGQFINLVTMQNHFPYDQNYYDNISKYEAKKVSSGTSIDSVNDFATGIHYTDEYLKNFIAEIDKIQKPITIVFYGDHLPGIYGNDMAKDGMKLHETDYFIYSNKYARQHGAKKLVKETKYVVPNDFIAMVAKQTNSKVNWYQALLTTMYEKLPAMTLDTSHSTVNTYNTSAEFVNQQGKVVKKSAFTKEQKQIWHDYQLIQYDVTAGKHYTSKYFK